MGPSLTKLVEPKPGPYAHSIDGIIRSFFDQYNVNELLTSSLTGEFNVKTILPFGHERNLSDAKLRTVRLGRYPSGKRQLIVKLTGEFAQVVEENTKVDEIQRVVSVQKIVEELTRFRKTSVTAKVHLERRESCTVFIGFFENQEVFPFLSLVVKSE